MVSTIFRNVADYLVFYIWDGDADASAGTTKIIRIGAGILAVIILVILIQRRRTRVK